MESTQVKKDLFEGLKFYVQNGDSSHMNDSLLALKAHGGELMKKISHQTDYIIVPASAFAEEEGVEPQKPATTTTTTTTTDRRPISSFTSSTSSSSTTTMPGSGDVMMSTDHYINSLLAQAEHFHCNVVVSSWVDECLSLRAISSDEDFFLYNAAHTHARARPPPPAKEHTEFGTVSGMEEDLSHGPSAAGATGHQSEWTHHLLKELYFEGREQGNVPKYWSIKVVGNVTTIRFGKTLDRDRHVIKQRHSSTHEALKYAEAKVKEKVRKGFKQIDLVDSTGLRESPALLHKEIGRKERPLVRQQWEKQMEDEQISPEGTRNKHRVTFMTKDDLDAKLAREK